MSAEQPETKAMNASSVRRQFRAVVDRVFRNKLRVVVERSGVPVAAVVSMDDLDRLRQWEARRAERFAALAAMQAAFAEVPDEELAGAVERALRAIRQARPAHPWQDEPDALSA